jgi:hypothetical protein
MIPVYRCAAYRSFHQSMSLPACNCAAVYKDSLSCLRRSTTVDYMDARRAAYRMGAPAEAYTKAAPVVAYTTASLAGVCTTGALVEAYTSASLAEASRMAAPAEVYRKDAAEEECTWVCTELALWWQPATGLQHRAATCSSVRKFSFSILRMASQDREVSK